MANNNPVGPLVILGDAVIGGRLAARDGGISDADGINQSTKSYQWMRDGEPITGATSQFYSVTSADAGTQISVSFSYTDNSGNLEKVTSKPKPTVPTTGPSTPSTPSTPTTGDDTPTNSGSDNPNNSDPVGPLAILGNALVGETLLARPNSITDADGINGRTASFQWLRDGEPITGQTNQFYTVTAADSGAQISVQYSYLDNGGTRETVTSKPEPAVPGGAPVTPPVDSGDGGDAGETPTTPDVPDAPTEFMNSVPIGKLVILGFPVEGALMRARTDSVYDRDGFDDDGASFQWLRDGEPIRGATGQDYVVTSDDRGAEISVQMSFVDGAGTFETVVSDPEPPVPFPAGEGPDVVEDASGEDAPGTPASGVLEGTPEQDAFTATSSLSRIDGRDNVDTVFFEGDQSNYVVSLSPDGVTVTDRRDGGLETIELDNVELLDFGTELEVFDGPMDLRTFGGQTGLSEEAFESFIEMYIAYFNRAPDAIGLSFWGTAHANGVSLEEIAMQFADQPEAGEVSNIRFVNDVYENVLGRAADIDGLRFWAGQLDDGNVERGEFILSFLEGVGAGTADDAYLQNKTDLGALFAVHRGMSNVEDAAMVMSLFDGSDESVQAAVEAIDTFYNAAMDPANGEFLMPVVGVLDNPFDA